MIQSLTDSDREHLQEALNRSGQKVTAQRETVFSVLLAERDHPTVDEVFNRAREAMPGLSLATVYNTLRRFTECGLLREVLVAPGKVYFDTNAVDHHHFFFEGSGELADIPADHVTLSKLPPTPPGSDIARVDVIIRLSATKV